MSIRIESCSWKDCEWTKKVRVMWCRRPEMEEARHRRVTAELAQDLCEHLWSIHSGDHVKGGQYICRWKDCTATFENDHELVAEHLQGHSGHKPYTCNAQIRPAPRLERCHAAFQHEFELKAHVESAHKRSAEVSSESSASDSASESEGDSESSASQTDGRPRASGCHAGQKREREGEVEDANANSKRVKVAQDKDADHASEPPKMGKALLPDLKEHQESVAARELEETRRRLDLALDLIQRFPSAQVEWEKLDAAPIIRASGIAPQDDGFVSEPGSISFHGSIWKVFAMACGR